MCFFRGGQFFNSTCFFDKNIKRKMWNFFFSKFCFPLAFEVFVLTLLWCFPWWLLTISCFLSPLRHNCTNCLCLDPPFLLVFVAHCEMWCLRISSVTAKTLTGIKLLDTLVAPFHKTSGSVVKPFVDAEAWTEGRLHQEHHISFTPAKKHCSSCKTSIP